MQNCAMLILWFADSSRNWQQELNKGHESLCVCVVVALIRKNEMIEFLIIIAGILVSLTKYQMI